MKKTIIILFFAIIFVQNMFAWAGAFRDVAKQPSATPTFYLGDVATFAWATSSGATLVKIGVGILASPPAAYTNLTWNTPTDYTYTGYLGKKYDYTVTSVGTGYYSIWLGWGAAVGTNGSFFNGKNTTMIYGDGSNSGSPAPWNSTYCYGTFTASALSNPTSYSAVATSTTQIDLSWTKETTAQTHNVIIVRQTSNSSWTTPTQGTSYSLGATLGSGTVVYSGNGSSYSDASLVPATTYYYKCYSLNNNYYSDGVLASATTISAEVVTDPLSQTAIKNETNPASKIDLSWTKNASGHNVMVVRIISGQSFTEPTPGSVYTVNSLLGLGTVIYNGSGTSFTDTGLASSVTYSYKFYSVSSNVYSAGVTSSATTDALILANPVSAIAVVNATSPESKVDISWTSQSNNVLIIRKKSTDAFTLPTQGITYSVGALIGSGVVVYNGNGIGGMTQDIGLTPSTAYNYELFTVVNNGYSSGVTTSTVTTNAVIDPTGQQAALNSANSESKIDLLWVKNTQANDVMIIRKKSTDSWTEPTQGIAYTVGSSIGSGVVVYNGSGTSFTSSNLTPSTGYDYKFYSTTNNCYSIGVMTSTIYTTAINDPVSQVATGTADVVVRLSWEKNAQNSDVLVVRKLSADSWTEPLQGSAYVAGGTIGSGKVVYNGSAAGFEDSGLSASTTYVYKFYSVIANSYSTGVTASATTTPSHSGWWTYLKDSGSPKATYFLGDYLTTSFGFEINNQDTTTLTKQYGWGQTTDGVNWIWRNATYDSRDGTNFVFKSVAAQPQFKATGKWYYSGKFIYTADGYTEYASGAWAGTKRTLSATSYYEVNAINTPSAQSATGVSNSEIDLAWTKNAQNHNILIIRKLSSATWTEPTQGTEYAIGASIGSGTVIYNSNGTSYSNTGLLSSTAYDYKFYSVNNNYYSSGVVASTKTSTAATDYFRSKTTGNWNSTDTWESSSNNTNWVQSTLVPSSSPTTVTILDGHIVSIDENVTVNSLILNSGSTLTINAGKQLTVNSTLSNSGTLNLLSDALGTATILTPSSLSGNGGIYNVNQHLTYRTWYMSSPVASATPSGMGVIKYFDETVAGNTWTPTTTMTAGKGYFVTPIDDEDHISNILFSGSLNSGNQDITLTRTLANTEKPGFNLIGNPYPSYLDWTAVCSYSTDGGTTHPNQDIMPTTTMWYRTKASGTWDFVTVNGEGVKSPSEATATKYIPPMQAFWVRAKNTGTSTLKLTDAMCSHAGTAENPSPNALKAPAASQSALQILRLQVSNGTNTDETVIYFSANASNDMDKIDAPKMSNENATIPEIYTTLGTERIVINAMHSIPLDQPIGLGFVPGSAASFSIKANEVSNLPADVKVILKDNVTLAETDLTDGTAVYQFSPETTSADRFSVIFRSSSTTTGLNNNNVNGSSVYWINNQGLTFRTNDDKLVGGNISVYNAIGQKLLSKKITGTSMNIDFNYTPDVYIVKVNNVTAKVIVK